MAIEAKGFFKFLCVLFLNSLVVAWSWNAWVGRSYIGMGFSGIAQFLMLCHPLNLLLHDGPTKKALILSVQP